MRRGCGGAFAGAALAIGLATGPSAAGELALPGPALPGVLGPAAVAVGDLAPGAAGNPALLVDLPCTELRADLATGIGHAGAPSLSLGVPTLGRMAYGFGFDHATSGGDTRRQQWLAALARRGPGHTRWGATLRLRDTLLQGDPAASWGLDAGFAWRPVTAWNRTTLEVGARGRDLAGSGSRSDPLVTPALEIGCAWARSWGGRMQAGAALGYGARRDAAGGATLALRAAVADRAQAAAAWTTEGWRAGVGVRWGRAHLEYALGAEPDIEHTAALRMALGPSVQRRQQEQRRAAAALLEARIASEMSSRREQEVHARLAAASEATARGDHEAGANLYREVLLWSPDDPTARSGLRRAQRDAMLVRADSALERGEWAAATARLEDAARFDPQDSLVAARLRHLRSTIRRADDTRSAAAEQIRLGLEAFAAEQYSAAGRCFEAALRLDPAHEVAGELLQRARTARANQLREAQTQARARLRRHDASGARAALQPALDDGPVDPEIDKLRSLIERAEERELQERRVAEARRQEESAVEDRSPPAAGPRVAATYEHGLQMYRAGDLPAAMEAWEEVARYAPHFAEVDRYLLRVYRVVGLESYTEGRLQEAIAIWSKAIRLEPDNPQVRRYLEQANAKLHRAQSPKGTR